MPYDVGLYSVLVTRDKDLQIRAYVNSCPHRGMQLADAGPSGCGKQFFRCPFHGMSWHLDGTLGEIPCRWDIPHIKGEEFRLHEMRAGVWGGLVFIHLDKEAQPLESFLGMLPAHRSRCQRPVRRLRQKRFAHCAHRGVPQPALPKQLSEAV